MIRKIIATATLFLLALSSWADYNEDRLLETNSYLKELKQQLDEEREQLEEIENTKKQLAEKIDNLNETIDYQKKLIRELTLQSREAREAVMAMDKEMRTLEVELRKLRESIEQSNIYLIDNIDYVNVKLLLFSKHSRDTIKNMEIVENINLQLIKKVSAIKEKTTRLEQLTEEKEAKAKDLEHLVRVKRRVMDDYEAEQTRLEQLVAVMKEDEASKNEYMRLLKEKQEEFENKLDRIRKKIEREKEKEEEKKADSSGFASLKGKLDWPVRGTVIEHFGPKKVKGFKGTIQNKGIKIRPGKSGEIRTVYGGTVKYVDTIRGFGNLVIVRHPDSYFTLYANMDRVNVTVGQELAKGQAIGTVGVDLGGVESYLYFEIRRHNVAVNPAEWLKPL